MLKTGCLYSKDSGIIKEINNPNDAGLKSSWINNDGDKYFYQMVQGRDVCIFADQDRHFIKNPISYKTVF